jgi:hypothetical protein
MCFLNQGEKTDDKSMFGFRSIGPWLGTVGNADQPPESRRDEQAKMPNPEFSKLRKLASGAAALRVRAARASVTSNDASNGTHMCNIAQNLADAKAHWDKLSVIQPTPQVGFPTTDADQIEF